MESFTDKLGITVTSDDILIGNGRAVKFNAEARGIGTLRYQWRKRGRNRLSDKVLGSDTPILRIPKVRKSDKRKYYCIVTNMWNRTVESNNVIFSVYSVLVY